MRAIHPASPAYFLTPASLIRSIFNSPQGIALSAGNNQTMVIVLSYSFLYGERRYFFFLGICARNKVVSDCYHIRYV
ncbi:hypothetical protein EDWATA_01416 [Edwardsiella tarda ATCC 23685]|uniref:Uncharacterized protein n=1 Tax=Edwardsiella tarda ATCC 23685 TaxID=500638 RepID=D4F3V1_EDWTA|nr:hypothetical protein EDWATA_01416 [Edwardsiella tarda ATCC 23685]